MILYLLQEPVEPPLGGAVADIPSNLTLLIGLSMIPIIAALITSFTKIVVTLSLLRQALATQNTPPNSVLTGLALILSIHIMAPVGAKAWNEIRLLTDAERKEPTALIAAVNRALRPFLERHSEKRSVALFDGFATKAEERSKAVGDALPQELLAPLKEPLRTLTVFVPAFLLTELKAALVFGFMLFLPFLVLDFVVTTILMSLGMQNLMPTTVSLPLKLLLFVLADGWRFVIQNLVGSYS